MHLTVYNSRVLDPTTVVEIAKRAGYNGINIFGIVIIYKQRAIWPFVQILGFFTCGTMNVNTFCAFNNRRIKKAKNLAQEITSQTGAKITVNRL